MIQTPNSSNINRFGHDGIDLFIEFKKSLAVYSYSSVPREVYHAMHAAESVGVFFAANIKKPYVCLKLSVMEAREKGFEALEV